MMDFDHRRYPKIINMGAGNDYRKDCLNIDLDNTHQPDLIADASSLPMLPDNYYEEIIAQDVLEHLPRNKTLPTLKEWNRILKTGGRLNLRLPDVIGLLTLLNAEQDLERHFVLLQCLFGSQQYEGDFHYTGFTRITLEHHLSEAGFTIRSLRSIDKWLFDVLAVKTATAETLEASDVKDFIIQTYRRLLKRDPDPGGLQFYLEKLMTEQMDAYQFKNELLASSEYVNANTTRDRRR